MRHIFTRDNYDFYFDGRRWEKQLRIPNGPIKKLEPTMADYKHILDNLTNYMAIYEEKTKPLPGPKSGTPSRPGSCHNQ